MLDETDPSPSILVIAAWHERDGLRARITSSEPGASGGRTSRVVSTASAAVDAVREWFEQVNGEAAG